MLHSCLAPIECVPRWQQFHVAPAMQQPNSALTTSVAIQKWCCAKLQSLIQSRTRLECSGSAQEQITAPYICHCEMHRDHLKMRHLTSVHIKQMSFCALHDKNKPSTTFRLISPFFLENKINNSMPAMSKFKSKTYLCFPHRPVSKSDRYL